MYFTRSAGAVSVTGIEKVKKLTVRVVVQDCTGTARFTDIMLPVSYTHLTLPTNSRV